jgi:hypothetical protein
MVGPATVLDLNWADRDTIERKKPDGWELLLR